MRPYDERRKHDRHNLNAQIIYAFKDSDQFSKARMCNYCEGGMCFEVDDALVPGSDIYIMMEDFSPDAVDVEFYDGYLAEIRWCRKIAPEQNENFIVGVKYYKTCIK